ncbi:uncharacterized protein H6S33_008718 [Morchella sextelata]|uniref:uncharacterized protein n=1 Tax=Morchella sextelata TaxID=1174677 RepID=UPI001D03824F|nr:uncharacterized protein H6S33_008718 [Morchella sextelata]KAH0602379.1 hypothetical protein H6S33_008718 [Morchella sextelata]
MMNLIFKIRKSKACPSITPEDLGTLVYGESLGLPSIMDICGTLSCGAVIAIRVARGSYQHGIIILRTKLEPSGLI